MTSRIASLVALAALLTLLCPSARADVVDVFNAVRAEGCGGRPGIHPAVRESESLRDVARRLAAGESFQQALARARYRAQRSATMHIGGSSDERRLARMLASRFCAQVLDPTYREIGTATRGRDTWIVLATPFASPRPGSAREVGQQVLRLVNAARARPRRCGDREFAAARPLVQSRILERAASAHALDMAAQGYLDHRGRDGSQPADRASRAGYRWRLVGENIAAGPPSAEEVVAGWLDSPGHCANIMEPRFREMGVAYGINPESRFGIYWAQVFGLPR